ncbi:hypothetical protein L6164_015808 [Bauhinia variegata]|uniref:Uncharacterized protein n=1 Tax=Bauhinia variegata TaxID=167791 RepID=A0ACB9NNT7_BAUVA|nr:hypothetical protein L6164_015808 [Bauhinia variegata]
MGTISYAENWGKAGRSYLFCDFFPNLPVQDPPCHQFSTAVINGIKVEGGRLGEIILLIPFARIDDFAKGESSIAECPADFQSLVGDLLMFIDLCRKTFCVCMHDFNNISLMAFFFFVKIYVF